MRIWERSIPIATFVVMVVGGIFFFGGEWRSMKDKIEWLSSEVTTVRQRMESIEQGNARRRLAADEQTGALTPQFERGGSVR